MAEQTRLVLVTGTDTGVGKTYVTAALTAALRAQGVHAIALKPVETGWDPPSSDAGILARVSERRSQPFVTVFFGNPYTAMGVPEAPAMLLTYDFSDAAERSAVRAIAGEIPITGKLPITLPGLFPLGHGLQRSGSP